MIEWGSRPLKREARSFALFDMPLRRRSLWLPAADAICVTEALQRGVLDRDSSQIICVERDSDTFHKMVRTVTRLRFRNTPIYFQGDLESFRLPFELDYANLDFCGSLTEGVARWVHRELADHLAPDATLVLTCRFGWRNNRFMEFAEERLLTAYREIAHEVTVHTMSRHEREIVPLLVFLAAIHDHKTHTTALRYRDRNEDGHGQPMMLYRMDHVRRRRGRPTGLPTFAELTEGYMAERRHETGERKKRDVHTAAPGSATAAEAVATIQQGKSAEEIAEEAALLRRRLAGRQRAMKAWDTRRKRNAEKAKEAVT